MDAQLKHCTLSTEVFLHGLSRILHSPELSRTTELLFKSAKLLAAMKQRGRQVCRGHSGTVTARSHKQATVNLCSYPLLSGVDNGEARRRARPPSQVPGSGHISCHLLPSCPPTPSSTFSPSYPSQGVGSSSLNHEMQVSSQQVGVQCLCCGVHTHPWHATQATRGHTADLSSFWRASSCSCAILSGPRCLRPLGPSHTSLLMAALRMLICKGRAAWAPHSDLLPATGKLQDMWSDHAVYV